MGKQVNIEDVPFPKWNPQKKTLRDMESLNFKIRLKALRNSSSGFIKRVDVREYIFERDGKQCAICHSKDNLQIDHIKSVYSCARGFTPIELLNTAGNFQILCKSCNTRKQP
jgi:5-methylcytosine-specific restriction endonuclease McrA